MIFVVEDNEVMAECIARAAGEECLVFDNVLSAMEAANEGVPRLVFLDILLNGPDGFSLLNEFSSYEDTARVPVVIVTSLNLRGKDLSSYGVREILSKDTFTPEDIQRCVREYAL